jgi:hypothetical protein
MKWPLFPIKEKIYFKKVLPNLLVFLSLQINYLNHFNNFYANKLTHVVSFCHQKTLK